VAEKQEPLSEHEHRHDHGHGTAPGGQNWGELGSHLELQAEVLAPVLAEAVSLLRSLAASGALPVRQVVDIGSGPGTAATVLAEAFPDASVLALEQAPALLATIRERADRMGLGQRVTAVPTDLEKGLGVLPPIDIAWASMVLHHLADAAGLLRQLHSTLRPGGLVALVEFGPPTRTLPHVLGFGEPGFGRRHADALRAAIEAHLPPGAMRIDWAATLSSAGFEDVLQRTSVVDLGSPLPERARQWVCQEFARTAVTLQERLTAADRATLAILLDPGDPRALLHRPDLELHAGRSLYIARKPR